MWVDCSVMRPWERWLGKGRLKGLVALAIERRAFAPGRYRRILVNSQLVKRDLMRRQRHLPLSEQVANLNQVLRGHYAYYGIGGNFRALLRVHRFVERYWYKMLCSRSRKGQIPWEAFHRIKGRFPLQRPRLTLPYRQLKAYAVL